MVGALSLALFATGCGGRTPNTPAADSTPGETASPVGADANAVIKAAFPGAQELGGGHGGLQPTIGNTLAGTPEGTVGVTFAFTCTGGAQAKVSVEVGETVVAAAGGDTPCDGSIFQRSIDMPKPNSVGFAADISGSPNGSFAFGYFTEKTGS